MSSLSGKELDPLLQNQKHRGAPVIMTRTIVALFVFGLIIVYVFETPLAFWRWHKGLPDDPLAAAIQILKTAPVIVSD